MGCSVFVGIERLPPRRASISQAACLSYCLALFTCCAASAAETKIPAGPCEIKFKNGKSVRGEIVSVEGDRFRFKPYDGEAFMLSWSVVKEACALTESAAVRSQARALAEAGKHDQAIELITKSRALDPALDKDLLEYVAELESQRRGGREKALETCRKEYDARWDKRQYAEALDATRHYLISYPGDADAMGDALLAEFRIHRAQAKPAGEFKSVYLDKLRKADPESGALRSVEAEMNLSKNMQAKFTAERESFLATALEQARGFHKDFRLEETIEILERALGYGPPAEQAAEMSALLAKARGEYEAEKADDREEERKRAQASREKKKSEVGSGGDVSDRQIKQFAKRRERRQRQRSYNR